VWDRKVLKITLESVKEKVSSCSCRTALVAHVDGELAGTGELKYHEYTEFPVISIGERALRAFRAS